VIEFNRKRSTFWSNCQWLIEATMFNPKIIECAKCGAGKVSKFWVISLGLKLSDYCNGDDDFMLIKAQ
jgi:hypothetical protein